MPVKDEIFPTILLFDEIRFPEKSYSSASHAICVIDKLGSIVITPSLPKHEG